MKFASVLVLLVASTAHSRSDSDERRGLMLRSGSGGPLCNLFRDRDIERRCTNNENRCEALADLDRDSCDEWCERVGLECTRAWDDGRRPCQRDREVGCGRGGYNTLICRCEASSQPPPPPPTPPLPPPFDPPRPPNTPDGAPTPSPPRNAGLCSLFEDRDIEGNEICTDTQDECKAVADLDRDSCDDWCERKGLTCTKAWDDGDRFCQQRNEISCGSGGKRRSICKCERQPNLVVRFNDLAAQWVELSERGPTISSHFWFHVNAALFDAFNAFETGTTGVFADLGGIRQSSGSGKAQRLAMTDSAYNVITTLGQTQLGQQYLEAADGEDAAERLGILMGIARGIQDDMWASENPSSSETSAARTVANAVTDAILESAQQDRSNYKNDYVDNSGYQVSSWVTPIPELTDPLTDFNFLDGTWTYNTFDPIRADEVPNTGYRKVHPLVQNGELTLTQTYQSKREFGIFEGGVQTPLTPQWGRIKPISFSSSSDFRVPVFFPSNPDGSLNEEWLKEAEVVADIGRAMQGTGCPICRAISEYWELGDEFVYPPGWGVVRANDIARDRNYSIKDAVQLIFGVTMTVYDAGIAAWESKYFYDTIRPMTTINEIFCGSTVGDWRADKEAVIDDRDQWRPYQSDKSLTPPFPDVPSGHSAFSTSASVVLRNMLGSNVDDFTTETFKSRFDLEKGFDGLSSNGNEEWTFNYKTHSRPADDSGYSRLYGGIHLMQGNIVGLNMGLQVGHASMAKLRQLTGEANLGLDPVEELYDGLVFGTGEADNLVAPCIRGSPVEVYGWYGDDVLEFNNSGNCGPVYLFGGWGADTFRIGARATVQDYDVGEDVIRLLGVSGRLTASFANDMTTIFANGVAVVDVAGQWDLNQLNIQT